MMWSKFINIYHVPKIGILVYKNLWQPESLEHNKKLHKYLYTLEITDVSFKKKKTPVSKNKIKNA